MCILIAYYGSITIIKMLQDSQALIRALNELAEETKRTKEKCEEKKSDDSGTCEKCNKHFQKLSHHFAHCKAK
jgi:hypothetical protein